MTLVAFVVGLAVGVAGTIYALKKGWIKLEKVNVP